MDNVKKDVRGEREKNLRYRNDSGTRLTKCLFFETTREHDKVHVIYTLKDRTHRDLPSLYQLYMGCEDLTEYQFANKHLDGWEHWKILCECDWFKPYLVRWREELELLIKGRALRHIQEEAAAGTRSSAGLNKWLVEGGWKDKNHKVRPTKQAITQAAKEEAQKTLQIAEDYDMIIEKELVH